MSKPKVSVIIPIYNQEAYLADCLDSLKMQTLQEVEFLCMNDGSTDRSGEIARAFRDADSRFRLIESQNKGVSFTRNAGIREAEGDYVIFCDPDDFYPTADALERLYRAAERSGMLIVGGSFSRFMHDTQEIVTHFDKTFSGYTFATEGPIEYRDYQFDYGFHRFLFKKDFLVENEIEFPAYKRYQDPVFLVNALSKAGSFYALPDIVYRYRSGHRKVQWTPEKRYDLACAMEDILVLSLQNRLYELYSLTVERMNTEYRGVFSDLANDQRLFMKMLDINSTLLWSVLNSEQLDRCAFASGEHLIVPLQDFYYEAKRTKNQGATEKRSLFAGGKINLERVKRVPRKLLRAWSRLGQGTEVR